MITNNEWQNRLIRLAWAYHRKDMTLQPLEDLKEKGYTHVTWKTTKSCQKCKRAARKYRFVKIDKFITLSDYDAPMASKSHPDDNTSHCYLLVTRPGQEERKEEIKNTLLPDLENRLLTAQAKVEETEDEYEKQEAQEELEKLTKKKEALEAELENTLPDMTVDYDGNVDQA